MLPSFVRRPAPSPWVEQLWLKALVKGVYFRRHPSGVGVKKHGDSPLPGGRSPLSNKHVWTEPPKLPDAYIADWV